MRQIGSQSREALEESGYNLIHNNGQCVLLECKLTGHLELWGRNDDFAGYVIEVDGEGYEFIADRRDGKK